MDTEVQDGTRVIEVDEIMQMIPHRYPFLLVDRVVDVIPNLRAVGIKL